MNEQVVRALAEALGVRLSGERVAGVVEQLEGQIAGRGGMSSDQLEGVEPATVFRPEWGE